MFGAQIPRRNSSFHNKHVNPHMLCLIMAPSISPQATGTISKLAQILFILSVLSASGWAGASQLSHCSSSRGQEPSDRGVTHRAGNRITTPLSVTMATTQQACFGQKCQFKQLLISSYCPCITPSLDKVRAIAGHSIYQIRNLVLIQLENNVSLFWLILFQTVRFLIQFLIHHVCTVEEMAEVQGQGWGLLVLSLTIAKTEQELSLRLWTAIQCFNSFGSPGSFVPCLVSSPFPLLPFCKW